MFKFSIIEYMVSGASESLQGCGTYTRACFSKSPKKAMAFDGAFHSSLVGLDTNVVMECRILEKDGKVILKEWN